MFWSTSKERKTPPSQSGASDHSGVRERAAVTGEDAPTEPESRPAEGADGARMPRRQRPTPPESPSSKRGGDLGSQPPDEDAEPST